MPGAALRPRRLEALELEPFGQLARDDLRRVVHGAEVAPSAGRVPDDELAGVEALELVRGEAIAEGFALRREQEPAAGPEQPLELVAPRALRPRGDVREDGQAVDEVESRALEVERRARGRSAGSPRRSGCPRTRPRPARPSRCPPPSCPRVSASGGRPGRSRSRSRGSRPAARAHRARARPGSLPPRAGRFPGTSRGRPFPSRRSGASAAARAGRPRRRARS